MTAVINELELNIFEEFDIPCDGVLEDDSECTAPAEVSCQMACCGATLFYCRHCYEVVVELWKKIEPMRFRCQFCHAWMNESNSHFINMQPLRKP